MAEISVELKLALDSLQSQAKKAASILKINLGGDIGKVSESTNKAAEAQDKLEKNTKKTTTALQKQLEEWRKLNVGGIALGQKVTIAAQQASKGLKDNPFQSQAGNMNGGLATAPPIMNPQPPKIPLPMVTVPNPQFKVAPQTPGLGTQIANIRKMILPIGQILASLYLMKRAIELILSPLKMFANMLAKAYENGKKLYASALTSGMGIGMTVKRGALAGALGVSENEIFQFGKAIEWIGDRFNNSSHILAENAKTLAAVSWSGAALSKSFQALWSELANEFAPVIIYLQDAARLFIETLSNSDIISGLGKELAAVFAAVAVSIKVVMVAVSGLALIFQGLADTLTWVMVKINNLIAKIPGAGKLGFTHVDDKNAFSGSSKIVAGIVKQFENNNPFKKVNAPSPTAFMKQMPASQWEKMGLQIGGSGGTNYAMQTAKHTARATTVLEKILQATNSQKFNITKPVGLPSGA